MSAQPTVSVAIGDYDHTRDVVSGAVEVRDANLEFTVVATPEETFSRFLGGEWDAAEMSLAVVTALRAQGDDSLVVLPVFPARAFRHGAIFVREGGPTEPAELNGARIGIPAWIQTAGIYVRGLLASDYGVDLQSVKWVQAGVDEPGRTEPVAFDHGRFDITPDRATSLNELLLAGEVDAVISARPPAASEVAGSRIGRLFPSPVGDEMKYAKDSRIFPIMHTLVLRRSVYEQTPAIAEALVSAFTDAKDRSLRRALEQTVPSYPLPWAAANARRAQELIGEDFWPYGIEPNRETLEAFLGYAVKQGVTPSLLDVSELFAREPAMAGQIGGGS